MHTKAQQVMILLQQVHAKPLLSVILWPRVHTNPEQTMIVALQQVHTKPLQTIGLLKLALRVTGITEEILYGPQLADDMKNVSLIINDKNDIPQLSTILSPSDKEKLNKKHLISTAPRDLKPGLSPKIACLLLNQRT
jgi:hypothetical protein